MRRPAATIVIPAWTEWALTRDCLASLRPTLGVHDTVVVVDNGSEDGTAAGLAKQRWVTVITNDENRGFAAACNQGAAAATGDVVVFLNNDTLVTGRWLDSLLAPFADATVAATGPRSNMVSGPQLVQDVGYHPDRAGELNRFTRAWRDDHRDEVTETERLVGFCLAVRRAAFDAIGGFDEQFGIGGCEDDDLCTRLIAAGGRLLIAHESFVHHHGHRTFDANGVDWFALQQENAKRYLAKHGWGRPGSEAALPTSAVVVSACLIVRDEEQRLPDCLASLAGVADEIVVYDTGSVDRTVEVATAAGARVVEGYWDDDFARARNAALEACRGEWILHVDADEVLVADEGVRDALTRGGLPDGMLVQIDNVDGEGVVRQVHQACRLFRRDRAHWLGRIHEQVVARPGQAVLDLRPVTGIVIRHSGYAPEVVAQRKKSSRNIRIAAVAAKQGGTEGALGLLAMGQAAADDGDLEAAVEVFTGLRDKEHPVEVRTAALRMGAEVLLRLGQAGEALVWVQDLRTHDGGGVADLLEGVARTQLGDHAGAMACLDAASGLDAAAAGVSPSLVAAQRGLALAAAERWDEAADALLEVATGDAVPEVVWVPLADALWRAGRDATPMVACLNDARVALVAGQLLTAAPGAADGVAEAMWERWPGDARVVAFAARVAPELELGRTLEWAARIRQAGAVDSCPLVAVAERPDGEPLHRIHAAAVAHAAFGEERARAAVTTASGAVPEAAFHDLFLEIDSLAPELLPDVVVGLATTPARSLAVAKVLHGFGASEEAAAVLVHGFGASEIDPDVQAEGSALLRELTDAVAAS